MANNGLTQVVTQSVLHQNTIDLFFTNNPTCVYNTTVTPWISAHGHHAVYVKCDITLVRNKQVSREIKLYCKTDCEGLKDWMSTVTSITACFPFQNNTIFGYTKVRSTPCSADGKRTKRSSM